MVCIAVCISSFTGIVSVRDVYCLCTSQDEGLHLWQAPFRVLLIPLVSVRVCDTIVIAVGNW